jgi:hypothetical protein
MFVGQKNYEISASHCNADKVSSLLDVMPVDLLATISKDSSVSIFMVIQGD